MGGAFAGAENKKEEGISRNKLTVSTLNYCGIMYSPYELYT